MSEMVSVSNDFRLLKDRSLIYLATLRLLCTKVYLARSGQRLHIPYAKLLRDAWRLPERLISCTVDELQRDAKDLGSGGVDGGICCR
jgi:hypothetical protein